MKLTLPQIPYCRILGKTTGKIKLSAVLFVAKSLVV